MIEKFQKAPFEEIAAQCETKVSFWNTCVSVTGDVLATGDLCYCLTAALTSEVQFFVFSYCLCYYQCWEVPLILSVLLVVSRPIRRRWNSRTLFFCFPCSFLYLDSQSVPISSRDNWVGQYLPHYILWISKCISDLLNFYLTAEFAV